MNFSQWLAANGYDEAALTPGMRKHLEAAYKAETQPPIAALPSTVANPPANPQTQATSFDEEMAAIRRESQRVEQIREITATACRASIGSPDKIEQFNLLCRAAVEEKWDLNKFQLAMLRAERSIGMMVTTPKAIQATGDIVEAALCMSQKLPEIESHYDEQTLAAADKKFRRGLGLQEVILLAAEQRGHRGSMRDLKPLLRAAFAEGDSGEYGMRADVGPSTLAISGILSNVANKFLRVAFMNVEQSWRKICTIRPVNDFKTITSYSLTGDNVYEEVPAGGEINSGSLGSTSYTNAAKSYAKLLGVDRRDIVNDDLGALTGAGKRLGRGGALKLNSVFWAAWLSDSAFFPTDKSLNNYDDGATDSVLSLAGLTNADNIFRAQTNPQAPGDPAASPLGSIPRLLLVPTALRTTAWNLMNSQYVNLVTATTATQGTENPWRGQFEPVDSTYLGAANTNGSDTAWYLLASPEDLCVIEVCFLYGAEMPTIETAEMDLDRLGIGMRGYYDFGAAKQEYRGGVKLKGAA